jgi:hypothetical protein
VAKRSAAVADAAKLWSADKSLRPTLLPSPSFSHSPKMPPKKAAPTPVAESAPTESRAQSRAGSPAFEDDDVNPVFRSYH